MENIDLKIFLDSYNSPIIYNICSSDELNFSLNTNEFVISNTDPSYMSGEHWVAFYKNKKNVVEFFYSFGMLPSYYSLNFQRFIYQNTENNEFVYNCSQIQSNFSNICGLYCLLFYISISEGYSLEHFINSFHNNKKWNDAYCLRSVENIFHYTFTLQK